MKMFKKGEKAFTLIEIIIVCLVLAILATLAIPKYQDIRQQAKEETEKYLVNTIRNGLELYKSGLLE